jgi:glucose/arabinose dehydrogenase
VECLLAACLFLSFSAATAAAEPALPPGFQDSVVFDQLEQPTNFRFAPDGRVFVAEKPGKILVFESVDDTEPEVFADLRTDVYGTGDRGLLGIALDPKFEEGRPYVYALYTYDHILGDAEPPPKWGKKNTTGDPCPDLNGGDACLVSGRLVRLTAIGNQAEGEPGGEPVQKVLAEDWCQQFSSHSIGDLQFGPEGALYASGGDGASFTSADYGQFGTTPNPCGDPPGGKGTALTPPTAEGGSLRSQSNEVLNGKILRVDPDTGKGLVGNPLFGSEASTGKAAENEARIVAKGFRNPFRFTFDPQSGELYTDNVGSSEIEEIDRFTTPPTSLYNSGWPCFEGPERQFQFDQLGLNVCEQLYENEPGSTSEPFFYYSHGQSVVPEDECPIEFGSALGGISFYEGEEFPAAYKGALFFADPVRGCIWAMFPGADGKPDPSTAVRFMRENRIYPAVDIEEGPGGELYYADLFGDEEGGDGAIHRISYSPGAPTARLEANPPYGTTLPLKVSFDAGESSDPDGDTLEYDWDLNGNGSFETHGGETRNLEFTQKELEEEEKNEEGLNKAVAVRVSDGHGHSSVARVTVYPGDSPPQPEINSPLPSVKWGVGDEIQFSGSALDSKGEPLEEPLSYYWTTRLLHCPTGPTACHAHPLEIFSGVRTGEFLAPEHDYPSYLEITLRVADDRGLTASKTVKLDPRTVNLSLASSPPGVQLTAGLLQGNAPFVLTTVEGDHVLLSAPPTARIGGRAYSWRSWSDGGARAHSVLAAGNASYEAVYAPEYTNPPSPSSGEVPPPAVRTLPQTTFRRHPPKATRKGVAKFVFSSSEPGSSFSCKLDGGSYRPCSSSKSFMRLRPGRHVLEVVAVDAAGNRDPTPAIFTWKILRRKPR